MTRLPALIALLLAAVTSASARDIRPDATTEQRLATALAGRVAGTPRNCVDRSRLSGPEQIGARELIYRENGSRLWRNTLTRACSAPRGDETLVVESYGGQICRDDRFQRVNRNSGFGSGYCYLGAFTPYDRPARQAAHRPDQWQSRYVTR